MVKSMNSTRYAGFKCMMMKGYDLSISLDSIKLSAGIYSKILSIIYEMKRIGACVIKFLKSAVVLIELTSLHFA